MWIDGLCITRRMLVFRTTSSNISRDDGQRIRMEKCSWAIQHILLSTSGKCDTTTEAYKTERMKSRKLQRTAKFDHHKSCKEVYLTWNETIKTTLHWNPPPTKKKCNSETITNIYRYQPQITSAINNANTTDQWLDYTNSCCNYIRKESLLSRTVVNTATNLRVPWNAKNFLTSWELIKLPRRMPPHTVEVRP
jgi:hypothetical protein